MKTQESTQIKLWLEYANEDLKAAQELYASQEFFPHIIAYHCHQVAEKSFKAFLIAKNISYPKTHDLVVLWNLCKEDPKDIDILVEFKQPLGLFKLVHLENELSEKLNMPVDLVTKNALSPYIREKVLKQTKYFYGQK